MTKFRKYEQILLRIVTIYVKQFPEHSFEFMFDGKKQKKIGNSKKVLKISYKNANNTIQRIFQEGSIALGEVFCEGLVNASDQDYKYLTLMFVRIVHDKKMMLNLPIRDILRVIKATFLSPFFARESQHENINSHYSLSDWFENEDDANAFYLYWLNAKHIQYTCAKWDKETRNLVDAQDNKLHFYAKRLGITKKSKGKTVLDLGCGWGGFMFFLAENFGLKCHGITLSTAQARYIKAEAQKRKLSHLVDVTVENVHNMTGSYDYIVSVGLMEHIDDYDDLFMKIAKHLNKKGRAIIHTMVQYDYFAKPDPFLLKYIFPGGSIPKFQILKTILQKNFTVVEPNFLPPLSYAKTLDVWYRDFCKNEKKIKTLLKTKSSVEDADYAVRIFKHYLVLCHCGLTVNGHLANYLVYNK